MPKKKPEWLVCLEAEVLNLNGAIDDKETDINELIEYRDRLDKAMQEIVDVLDNSREYMEDHK